MKNRTKINYCLTLLVLLLVVGCSTEIISFNGGINQVDKISKKYSVDLKTMPGTIENAVLMRNELKEVIEMSVNAPESFKLFSDYNMKSLEANIIHLKAWEQGVKASTREGFGCKSLPVIVNSSILRNISAQKGYETLEILQEFIDKYPKEAASINITQRDVVFSNLYYYEVELEAGKDRGVIEHFCGHKYDLKTLEMKDEYK
ncbi:hypothetical protein ISS05_05370 [Candidatus Woesearchaeota archaeon]|nr:hypothetical protein [Candidatus Woesearchaeota archaeon]